MFMGIIKAIPQMSPSMRREWIEILSTDQTLEMVNVSLHAEGVD